MKGFFLLSLAHNAAPHTGTLVSSRTLMQSQAPLWEEISTTATLVVMENLSKENLKDCGISTYTCTHPHGVGGRAGDKSRGARRMTNSGRRKLIE